MNSDLHGLAGGPGAEISCQAGSKQRWEAGKHSLFVLGHPDLTGWTSPAYTWVFTSKNSTDKNYQNTHNSLQFMIKGLVALWEKNVVAD